MEETFMNSVVEKLELIEKKVNSSTTKKDQLSTFHKNQVIIAEEINNLKTTLNSLNMEVKQYSQELRDGIEKLSQNSKQPVAVFKKLPKREGSLNRPFNYLLRGCILLTLLISLAISIIFFNYKKINRYIA